MGRAVKVHLHDSIDCLNNISDIRFWHSIKKDEKDQDNTN